MQDIKYNNFSFNVPWILINSVRGVETQENAEVQALRLSRGDGRTFQDKKFNGKTITVVLTIMGTNFPEFQARVDTVKQALYGVIRGLLDIPYRGFRRGYMATTESIVANGSLGFGYTQQFTVTFLTEGFGFDLVDTEVLKTGMTSGDELTANETITFTNTGSYYAEPRLILDISEFDDIINLRIENLTLGQELNILPPPEYNNLVYPNPFTVTLDTSQARMFWEGVDTRTSGIFPFAWVGDNTFRISADGDRMQFDTRIRYKNRYL